MIFRNPKALIGKELNILSDKLAHLRSASAGEKVLVLIVGLQDFREGDGGIAVAVDWHSLISDSVLRAVVIASAA